MAKAAAFLLYFARIDADTNEENECPEGKEYPDGGDMASMMPGSAINGLSLAISGFSSRFPIARQMSSPIAIDTPSLRYFFEISSPKVRAIQMIPQFPA